MSGVYAKAEGITLVGGGELTAQTLERALERAPRLVAADGGADRALALGRRPDLVIGDLDSLSDRLRADLGPERLHHIETQDNTDFDKAIAVIHAPFILAVGFSGARLDHTLAAMNTLTRNPERRVIVDTGHDLCVLLPPSLDMPITEGSRVSLFPMAPVGCTSEGLTWSIDGLPFAPTGKIGTSNMASAGRLRLTADAPAMLLLLPVSEIDALISAVLRAPVWPADARGR